MIVVGGDGDDVEDGVTASGNSTKDIDACPRVVGRIAKKLYFVKKQDFE